MEFLLHASSIHEADIANFGYAIHELMVRVGVAEPSSRIGEPMTEDQLWAAIEVGLIWLRRLHSLVLTDELEPSGASMKERLQGEELGPIMSDIQRAKLWARWGGGRPLWFLALVVVTCGFLIAASATYISRSAMPSVQAAGSGTIGIERRLVEVESQLRIMNDDATYRQKLGAESDRRLRERIEALEGAIND